LSRFFLPLPPRHAIDWDQRIRETRVQRWIIQTSSASENIVFLNRVRDASLLWRVSFLSTARSSSSRPHPEMERSCIEISPRGTTLSRSIESLLASLRRVAGSRYAIGCYRAQGSCRESEQRSARGFYCFTVSFNVEEAPSLSLSLARRRLDKESPRCCSRWRDGVCTR